MSDIKAILLIISIGQALSIIILFFFQRIYGHIELNIKYYILAKLLQFFAPTLSLVFANNLSPAIMTLTISFFYPGLAIEAYCLVNINFRNPNRKLWVFLLLSAVFIIIYAFASESVLLRVIITSGYYSTIFLYVFLVSVFSKNNIKIQKLVGWIAFIGCVINIIRILFTVLSNTELELYNQSLIQILFLLVFAITAFIFPLLFVLIIQERITLELNELNSTKNKFFKIIGHDLKSPIAQMIQFSRIIEENYKSLEDEQLLELVEGMKESSSRGFKLLENLLDWSHSQTGNFSFTPTTFSLTELLIENVGLFEKQAAEKNIQIGTQNVFEGEIYADRNMINTVVRNLLSNAIKFTRPNGKIEIFSEIADEKLILSIKDNGVGISQNDCEKLFKIDSGHTTVGTNNEEGTGLGLILCKEFIDKHNGTIWVESKLNEGSTFSFSIPMK